MKIGMTYQPACAPESPFAPIDYTRSCGYDTLEIAVAALPEDADLRDRVIEYALGAGLHVSLHSPFGPNNITATDEERRLLSIRELLDTGSIPVGSTTRTPPFWAVFFVL